MIEDSYDQFNILLKDVCFKDLHETISNQLGMKYLSDSSQEMDSELKGIVFATILKINKIKIIYFLIDTGSLRTFKHLKAFDLFFPIQTILFRDE